MLFRCNKLVHVSSQPGVQWNPLDFACFHQSVILAGGVTQHLPVHRIRNLQGESFSSIWFGSYSAPSEGAHQHPTPLLLLHLSLQTRTDHVSQVRVECLHYQISQNLDRKDSRGTFSHPVFCAILLCISQCHHHCDRAAKFYYHRFKNQKLLKCAFNRLFIDSWNISPAFAEVWYVCFGNVPVFLHRRDRKSVV